jgi:hypothetical protein
VIWGSGSIAPYILNFGKRCFTPAERNPGLEAARNKKKKSLTSARN